MAAGPEKASACAAPGSVAVPAGAFAEAPPLQWELLAARLPEDQALWFWVRAKLRLAPGSKRREDRLLRLLFGAEFDASRAKAAAWRGRASSEPAPAAGTPDVGKSG